jgi:predicted dinucleotide-binding enzyme
MEIGTIGAGAFAQAFAKRALEAGHKVKLSNSRGPESLREVVSQLGFGATAAAKEEAAACKMVLLAVPWDNVPETLANLPRWKNQILIDVTNPFHGEAGNFTPADVGNLSTSQFVAALAHGARVVKALNTMRADQNALTSLTSAGTKIPGQVNALGDIRPGNGRIVHPQ